MALLFCDGFDSYAATADLTKKWSSATSPWAWSSSAGPDAGGCVVGTTASNIALQSLNNLALTTRLGLGFYLKISTYVASGAFLLLKDQINTTLITFITTSGGVVKAQDSSFGQILLGTRNICDNNWHWIEFDIGTPNGSTQRLYIDGVLEFSGTGANLFSATLNSFAFTTINGATVSVANVVAWNNTGSGLTLSNFPLGPRDITTLRPNGDGTVQFTRSTGSTSYTLLDEVNGDITDYVESGTSGHQDLYDYAPLGFTPTTINAVMLNSYGHNPNTGTINMQGVCKSSATTSAGTSTILPSTARVLQQPYELDPNGSIAWTQTNLDAAQFGIKVP